MALYSDTKKNKKTAFSNGFTGPLASMLGAAQGTMIRFGTTMENLVEKHTTLPRFTFDQLINRQLNPGRYVCFIPGANATAQAKWMRKQGTFPIKSNGKIVIVPDLFEVEVKKDGHTTLWLEDTKSCEDGGTGYDSKSGSGQVDKYKAAVSVFKEHYKGCVDEVKWYFAAPLTTSNTAIIKALGEEKISSEQALGGIEFCLRMGINRDKLLEEFHSYRLQNEAAFLVEICALYNLQPVDSYR